MATIPMAASLPLNGAPASRPNASPASTTAKVSDMIPIFQATKRFVRESPSSGHGKGPSPQSSITSLAYDDDGGLLLTSESNDTMNVYNVKEGKHARVHLSQKYGCMHAMFAHTPGCIIHSSTQKNNVIRYLSTHDNSYLRYFEGHEKNVTNLALHPGQDNFLSCSEDNTVRIWDISTKNACGKLNLSGAYLSAWDPSGNVFAVASPTAQAILLYDFRNYDKPPFSTFDVLGMTDSPVTGWNKLEFSNDGKHILLGTNGRSHLLIDAFDGHLKADLRRDNQGASKRLAAGEHNPDHVDPQSSDFVHQSTGDACFSPDGRYVLSGAKKNILVYDTLATAQNSVLAPSMELEYDGESAVLAFNPRYNFFASGDKEVIFWVPDQYHSA